MTPPPGNRGGLIPELKGEQIVSNPIPVRGTYFFSRAASLTQRGPSGKVYHFTRDTKTEPVIAPEDVQYFRLRDDVFEEGHEPAWNADRPGSRRGMPGDGRPLSYRVAGRGTIDSSLLNPPSMEEMRDAEERRRLFERARKFRMEGMAADATKKTGVGTKEAQDARAHNARVAAGQVSPFSKPPPRKSDTKPDKVAEPAKKVVEEPVVTPEVEEAKAEEPEEFVCEACGRAFKSAGGLAGHSRWCKAKRIEKALEEEPKVEEAAGPEVAEDPDLDDDAFSEFVFDDEE